VSLLLPFVAGWLIGTTPYSWWLVRWRTGKDLAGEGSGNVGALNTLRVARSRTLGAAALLLDVAKGAGAVLLARALGAPREAEFAAGVLAVLGHSLNPWLTWMRGRVSGGKGFATAAGAFLVLAAPLVGVWLAALLVAYAGLRAILGVRDEAPASLLATLAFAAAAWVAYDRTTGAAATALAVVILARLLPEAARVLRAGPSA
jgi:glycerol-3-phosphate acyltransferase PlsY